MTIGIIESRWDEFRRNLRIRWNKGRKDRFDSVNMVRERSISILQRRYGYTREQAIYQLDKHYSGAWLG